LTETSGDRSVCREGLMHLPEEISSITLPGKTIRLHSCDKLHVFHTDKCFTYHKTFL